MKIGIDIDEVLAKLAPELTWFYNEKFNKNYDPANQKEYDLTKLWECSIEVANETVWQFYDSPKFEKIKTIQGAKTAVKKLLKQHEMIAITARPSHVEVKTRNWIEKHYPKVFREIYFTGHYFTAEEKRVTKGDICKKLGIELMIDDHFEYALDCSQKGINVLLMDAAWNREVVLPGNVRRVKGWREIMKVLNV